MRTDSIGACIPSEKPRVWVEGASPTQRQRGFDFSSRRQPSRDSGVRPTDAKRSIQRRYSSHLFEERGDAPRKAMIGVFARRPHFMCEGSALLEFACAARSRFPLPAT